MLVQVSYDKATRVALVQVDAAAVPAGSVDVGSFSHPDEIYPDSTVIYHGVRDLLYKRSFANPAIPAMFPENITDMQNVVIELALPASVLMTPETASIAVAATQQMTTTIFPLGAASSAKTYSTSNAAVATVDVAGLVTGVAVGTATITVTTTFGGYTDTSEITVTA